MKQNYAQRRGKRNELTARGRREAHGAGSGQGDRVWFRVFGAWMPG